MSVEAIDTVVEVVLTAADRCDQCGAQAYVRAEFKSGELLFCGHHWKVNSGLITAQALSILDETPLIA